MVEQESFALLRRHARISIEFCVDRVLAPTLLGENGLAGIDLSEVAVESPWLKNYDAGNGGGPLSRAERFDLTHWGLLGAYEDHERVGGAVIAHRSADLPVLRDRDDLAVLWDLRVAPNARGRGVGFALLSAVIDWARNRGCRELMIETQNVNVAACRLYAHIGCSLGAINAHAYPEHPDEVQLLWHLAL